MGLNKTEFLPGIYLSYPLESLSRLFATVETVSRKSFFLKIAELDKDGGAGLSPDTITEIIWIGLQGEKPDTDIEKAREYVSKFNSDFGAEALEFKIIDAMADAKLMDKENVNKQRDMLLKMRDLAMQNRELELLRMELIVKAKTDQLKEDQSQPQTESTQVVDSGNLNPKSVKSSIPSEPKKIQPRLRQRKMT